jgi:DNA phosphorothioation-associated putative methyltransferase
MSARLNFPRFCRGVASGLPIEQLAVIVTRMEPANLSIPRHRTALRRGNLSRPMRYALEDGLIGPGTDVLDYGCGHGRDIELLQERGITCDGWDPVFRPDGRSVSADTVNLGFVINVIEDPAERASAMRRAWDLCRRLLVVSAQIQLAGPGESQVPFGDGILTGRGTFQKFYGQGELRSFIEAELGMPAVPASLGIFYVFKDESLQQQFIANRYRRRSAVPRMRISERRFNEHREILEPFMATIAELGRLPAVDEFPQTAELTTRLGSFKRAFALVKRVTGPDEWELSRKRRTEDLLVYLALARFRSRPLFSKLPPTLKLDIRAFFGTYTKACNQADALLFRAGDPSAIDNACGHSSVGKLLPDDLYVHRSAVEILEPLLRVYEGCGRAYLGEVEGANIIKIHRRSGKLSYLAYPDFETDPHPILVRCIRLSLRNRELNCYDYSRSSNPPILHRKELFLHCNHPLHGKFAKLTLQEEQHGLLTETSSIGTRNAWKARLRDAGFGFRGHRLVREKR